MDVGHFLRPVIIYLTLLNFHTCLGKFCFNQLRPMLPIVSMGVGAVIVSPLASYVLVPYGLTATMVGMSTAWGVQCCVLITLVLRDEALRHTVWLSCPWTSSSSSHTTTVETTTAGVPHRRGSGDDGEELSAAQSSNNNIIATTITTTPPTCTSITATSSEYDGMIDTSSSTTINRNNTVSISVETNNSNAVGTSSMNSHVVVFTWKGFNEYTSLALPSMVLVVGEGSAYDLSVLMAAVLGNAAGATWSAILNYTLWYVAVSGGISLSLIHISEPTRLLSISYAVFCLKKKKKKLNKKNVNYSKNSNQTYLTPIYYN
eukprot:TRINITY_DN12921_c0_g3_i4.p1 TRINITY_DN12921_c0_g3~~TRINITY_DN12921_c0_g3_i4.p1  ORF type:complete len:317 (+),score=49.11 TRINITY_DN12921_c0_g3_i4:198-1148(+)